jgi:hypothetical protein
MTRIWQRWELGDPSLNLQCTFTLHVSTESPGPYSCLLQDGIQIILNRYLGLYGWPLVQASLKHVSSEYEQ